MTKLQLRDRFLANFKGIVKMLSGRDIERIGRETLKEFYEAKRQGRTLQKNTLTESQINRAYQNAVRELYERF